jgi:hypothetical protein
LWIKVGIYVGNKKDRNPKARSVLIAISRKAQFHHIVMRNPASIRRNPMSRFQSPMPGMGKYVVLPFSDVA